MFPGEGGAFGGTPDAATGDGRAPMNYRAHVLPGGRRGVRRDAGRGDRDGRAPMNYWAHVLPGEGGAFGGTPNAATGTVALP
jgi:hypothetical protein